MTANWSKVGCLLRTLVSDPVEFVDRTRAVVEVQVDRAIRTPPDYAPLPWDRLLGDVTRALGADAVAMEREMEGLEALLDAGTVRLGSEPLFTLRHNADLRLARLCYLVCRALRPSLVVETGVAYGVTTTFVLQALERNAHGRLYSIDLPPLGAGADAAVGRLVPASLRARWTLLRGTSRRRLPPLLDELGQIDVFIHDSLHTFHNMRSEFAAAHRHRGDPFALIADDIEANGAFQQYLERHAPDLAFHATCEAAAKRSRCGICLTRSLRPGA
jgi:hypothetical protein